MTPNTANLRRAKIYNSKSNKQYTKLGKNNQNGQTSRFARLRIDEQACHNLSRYRLWNWSRCAWTSITDAELWAWNRHDQWPLTKPKDDCKGYIQFRDRRVRRFMVTPQKTEQALEKRSQRKLRLKQIRTLRIIKTKGQNQETSKAERNDKPTSRSQSKRNSQWHMLQTTTSYVSILHWPPSLPYTSMVGIGTL